MSAAGPAGPSIEARPVGALDASDLAAARRAFESAPRLSLGQAWRPEPEPEFAPGVVRAGWRDDAIVVLAELTDADVFTLATDHNQPFWELGDTFEMFLRPETQPAYTELHVAPGNLRLHLRFPDAGWLARTPRDEAFVRALRPADAFQSSVWIEPAARRWSMLAVIPAAAVRDRPAALGGSTWRFSFSRYDYTRGREAPVISSTSPHPMPSFHRQDEWGTVKFSAGA